MRKSLFYKIDEKKLMLPRLSIFQLGVRDTTAQPRKYCYYKIDDWIKNTTATVSIFQLSENNCVKMYAQVTVL